MNRQSSFYDKFGGLIILISSILGSFLLAKAFLNVLGQNSLGGEFIMMFTTTFLGLFGISGFFDGLFHKTSIDRVSLSGINKIVFLVSMSIGILSFIHIKDTEEKYNKFDQEYTIEETNDLYIFTSDNYKLLYVEKDGIKFDENNPIEIYKSYRIDIFGFKVINGLEVKTEPMDGYVSLDVINNN